MIALLRISLMSIFAMLMVSQTTLNPAINASSSNGGMQVGEWKTAYTVGRFLYSDPPKPDQIFRVHYRAINGTIESFGAPADGIVAKVNGDGDNKGQLEIKYPRNYPYSNEDYGGNLGEGQPVVFVDGQEKTIGKNMTGCFFVFSIPFAGSSKIELLWTYKLIETPHRGDDVPNSCIQDTVVQGVHVRKDGTISPLQQFKAGVAAKDIVCRAGSELVINPSTNNKPYCAKPSTARELVGHGWRYVGAY